jgi:lysylphosphatidylglycerol synthetase-like protein (DUF2156 family)
MMASRRQSRSSSNSGCGTVFVFLFVVGIIIKFIWWILGAVVVVGLFFLVRALLRESRKRADAYARWCAAVAARADEQHNWVLQGDDRGIYGPAGAEFMHYINPATNRGQAA